MTNELTEQKDERTALKLSETEGNTNSEVVTRERGTSIDDNLAKGIDVDAYYADRMFMFSSGRRRRASVIL